MISMTGCFSANFTLKIPKRRRRQFRQYFTEPAIFTSNVVLPALRYVFHPLEQPLMYSYGPASFPHLRASSPYRPESDPHPSCSQQEGRHPVLQSRDPRGEVCLYGGHSLQDRVLQGTRSSLD